MSKEYVWLVTTVHTDSFRKTQQYNMSIVANFNKGTGANLARHYYVGRVFLEKEGPSLEIRKDGDLPILGYLDNPIYAEDLSLFCVATITENWKTDSVGQFMDDIVDAIKDCGVDILRPSYTVIKKHREMQELIWQSC